MTDIRLLTAGADPRASRSDRRHADLARGIAGRGAIFIAGMFSLSLVGCASTTGHGGSNAEEAHTNGVRYALNQLRQLPTAEQSPPEAVRLTREYCASIAMDCGNVPMPPSRVDALVVVRGMVGSSTLKEHAVELLGALRGAPTLREFEARATRIERKADRFLASEERERFADFAAIARGSARLWAPVGQGGRGGRGITLPATTGSARKDINWKEVAAADAAGCLAGIEFGPPGCVAGAIAFSVADIIHQLLASGPS
jgi:hypothetical protein